MKIPKSNFQSQTAKKTQKQQPKKYKEDDDEVDPKENEKKKTNKFSFKALRKTIKTLCNEYAKQDIEDMIFQCDEDNDNKLSQEEFMNMYKKCIVDENEEEGKKLFYLVQFLMYDKEDKKYITIEDTLEILCARNQAEMDNNIDAIFGFEFVDEKGKKRKGKKEKLTYIEYADKMHQLSMGKRNEISNKKKNFCKQLQKEALENANKK